MDQNEMFRRYLDLGSSFSQVTRERAEEIMRELVNLGDLRLEQAQQWVDDVLDRSRRNTEALLDLIREEVSRQLSSMSLVTKEDVSRLVTRLSRTPATVRKTAKKAAKKRTAKKAPARARKAPARGGDQEGRDKKEGHGQEGHDKEGHHQEGHGQEDHQEGRGQEVDQEGRSLTQQTRRRLDAELVRRGMSPTRERARAAIAARQVIVGGAIAEKPARLVSAAEPIEVRGPPPRFVSRGGDKLDAALERFRIDVRGARALDAGASTGGFVDCLLARGAAEVVAVDVGRGQLDQRLRVDPRVVVLERTNVRDLRLDQAGGEAFTVVVADLSFISLRTVAPVLFGHLAAPDADVVALVKPQFEAGRAEASRGRGVVRDPRVWARVLEEVCSSFSRTGAAMMGAMVSPLAGASGNVEFLVHARAHADPDPTDPGIDLAAVVEQAAAFGAR